MQLSIYFQKIRREDGSYVFVIRSKGNDVPIAVSAHSYSSLDDCDQAIEGLAPEHDDEE